MMSMTRPLTLMVAAWAVLMAPSLCKVSIDRVTGDSVQQSAPMMVISQLTFMLAAWAMHIAQPMMMAHTHTAIRETVTSLPPDACTFEERNPLTLLTQSYAFNIGTEEASAQNAFHIDGPHAKSRHRHHFANQLPAMRRGQLSTMLTPAN